MNKLLIIVSIFSFLIFSIGSYFVVSNINPIEETPKIDLDGNFDRIVEELNDYDGAMIVSYDTETGEILGKRKVVISDNLSPSEAVEMAGGGLN